MLKVWYYYYESKQYSYKAYLSVSYAILVEKENNPNFSLEKKINLK